MTASAAYNISRALKNAYLVLILAFLYLPIAVLITLSFNESRARSHFTGFSLKWYAALLQDSTIMQALYNTLLVAVLASLIATVFGTLAAVGISRMGKNGKRVFLGINNLPVLNPDIVTGVSLMILFVFAFRLMGFGSLGLVTMLLAHISFNTPYVILSVMPRLKQMDPNLYEAALDLGSTPMHAFFRVILPEIFPGVVTGCMLAFTMSIDDFVISFFTTGSGVNNLSTVIYSMARRGINPEINALSTLMFIAVMVMLFIINIRDSDRNAKEILIKAGEEN